MFMAGDGNRRAIRLGKVSKGQAVAFKTKVEAIIGGLITSAAVDDETSRWMAALPDAMHARLAAVGLAKPRQTAAGVGLGVYIDAFIERQTTSKPGTLINLKQVRRWLVDCFGEARDIRTIGAAEAEDFRSHMVKGRLGENSIRRHVGRARQLFKAAIRRGQYRGNNPFDGMAATVRADKARQHFISRDVAQKVLDACPNNEWRLLFSLSRFGGLRCPSEHFALRWGDIDFEHGRIRVPSPKTEAHEGKACRFIPLFPELKKPLVDAYHEAEPGAEFVITRYRDPGQNLRTQLQRIIHKAGVTPWPKLWHNLRSTRQTELAEKYPLHVVCEWIGNSRAVAQEHYLQVTDAHFAAASSEPAVSAAQNEAQHTPEQSRNDEKLAIATNGKGPEFPSLSEPCGYLHGMQVTPTGFEPVSRP